MTWMSEQPTFVTTTDLTTIDFTTIALTIVDTERAPHVPTSVPIVLIGIDPGLPGVHVLSPKLTSRELKLAIRVAMPRGPRTGESAVG